MSRRKIWVLEADVTKLYAAYDERLATLAKAYEDVVAQTDAIVAQNVKTVAAYEQQIAQLTAERDAVVSELLKAKEARDSHYRTVNELKEEAAALKVLYLPYITNDVDNCQ